MTGLIDCGNWAVSASWRCRPTPCPVSTSPSSCATTPAGASEIPFVVRNDASTLPSFTRRRTPPGRRTTTTTRRAWPNPKGTARAQRQQPLPVLHRLPVRGAVHAMRHPGATEVSYNRPLRDGGIRPGPGRALLRRDPHDPVPGAKRLRRHLHQPDRHRLQRVVAAQPQDVHLDAGTTSTGRPTSATT